MTRVSSNILKHKKANPEPVEADSGSTRKVANGRLSASRISASPTRRFRATNDMEVETIFGRA